MPLDFSEIKDPAIRAQLEALAARDQEQAAAVEEVDTQGDGWPRFIIPEYARGQVGELVAIRNRFGEDKNGIIKSVIEKDGQPYAFRVQVADDLTVVAHWSAAGWYGL